MPAVKTTAFLRIEGEWFKEKEVSLLLLGHLSLFICITKKWVYHHLFIPNYLILSCSVRCPGHCSLYFFAIIHIVQKGEGKRGQMKTGVQCRVILSRSLSMDLVNTYLPYPRIHAI